ncbi:MAG TPA: hypothetical protein VFY14_11230 [Streptomyces sp.]|nr:hypothetical protein [Streptomyces sp.]
MTIPVPGHLATALQIAVPLHNARLRGLPAEHLTAIPAPRAEPRPVDTITPAGDIL